MSQANRGVPPKMVEIVIGEEAKAMRVGVYAPVYARLLELAEEHEANELDEAERRGLRVSMHTASNGHRACQRMNVWANEDGWQLVYGPPLPEGARDLYLQRPEEQAA